MTRLAVVLRPMDAQIVFIHIEKTAGTSLRALLDRVYGREQVVWRGRDLRSRRGRTFASLKDCRVVGGHLTVADFRSAKRPLLFLSVVRDPVSRAVSLFHYFAEHAPEKDRHMWRWKGLRPESMLETIEEVPAFRRAISNRQCWRLSGKASFESAKQELKTRNILVGDFDHLEEFGARLCALLAWPEIPLCRHNRAPRPDYESGILAEPGLSARLLELNREDQQLYEFIRGRRFHENIPDERLLSALRVGEAR